MSTATANVMPSVYKVPDIAKTYSFRLPASLRAKLEATREIWAELAKGEGAPDAAVNAIDLTHVVISFLERQSDEELAQWGGHPDTPEKLEAVLKIIRSRAKAQRK